METRHIRAFVAVAGTGNFTEAARRLFMAQSTLSRQIASLEATLGTSLFDRDGHGARLTAAGQAFLPEARQVLAAVEAAIGAVKAAGADGRQQRAG
jgi:DNA-binding transcriptional LysR family regulator